MTVPDPLSLDTSSWSTSPRDRDGQKDDEAIYDGTYSPAGAADGQDQGQNDKRSIPERNRSIASVMNDDARAARRASRKQRPSRESPMRESCSYKIFDIVSSGNSVCMTPKSQVLASPASLLTSYHQAAVRSWMRSRLTKRSRIDLRLNRVT